MALRRWEPWRGLPSLRREIDRLLEDFEDLLERGPLAAWEGARLPQVEVADTKDAVIVKALVPGVSKDDLQIEISENALTLKGERKEEEKQEGKNYYQREIRYGGPL
ncbi:MAG: hypothetical protein KatS3mg131_3700 [Candidatus Tectimicrobiota bacterium]|nr:MAG: hypothetical protein KatS3mg131_3700 [Candidatus Tectomicrobia bacterium]